MSYGKTVRVVVMDTGYYVKDYNFKACQNHELDRNFTADLTIDDRYPHGQNVNHIIAKGLENVDYCIVNVKIMTKNEFDMFQYEMALLYVIGLKPDIINLSFGGRTFSNFESYLVKKALNQGIKVVAAAGNENIKLTKQDCGFYPVCVDSRIIAVGCLKNEQGERCDLTNYGEYITIMKVGYRINAGGLTLTGTSQATAVETNELIRELAKGNR